MKNRKDIEERLSHLRKVQARTDSAVDRFPRDTRLWIDAARVNSQIESLEWVLDNEL